MWTLPLLEALGCGGSGVGDRQRVRHAARRVRDRARWHRPACARRIEPRAPFSVPAFPVVTFGFIALYATLFAVGVAADPVLGLAAGGVLGGAIVWSLVAVRD